MQMPFYGVPECADIANSGGFSVSGQIRTLVLSRHAWRPWSPFTNSSISKGSTGATS